MTPWTVWSVPAALKLKLVASWRLWLETICRKFS